MGALSVPGSWLACPRCDRTPLGEAMGRYRCDACGVDFPLVGGIPWLFADPEVSLGEWRSRVDTSLQTLRHDHTRLAGAAESANISALTRQRLRRLAAATLDHAERLKTVLAPLLDGSRTASYESNLASRAQVPWDQGLMTYAYNVHRDWAWGQTENEASFAIVRDALNGVSPGRMLVLGAGAGRLAYDLHMRTPSEATVVLDFNPFLLLLAQQITNGGSVSLYEFPLAAKSLNDCAVLRELRAEQPCRGGLHYVLADAQRLAFAEGSFDTVVTPWLVDILPEPFGHLCGRINALLADGGRWINFGSLNFHIGDPALQYSPEECAEIIAGAGFQAPQLGNTTMPYLTSPASRNGRVDEVLSWSTTKTRHVPAPPRPELLPSWLVRGNEPVPLLDVFRTQAPAIRLRGYILSLIDGRRSLDEIIAIFDQQKIMTHDEAAATIRSLLIKMYELSRRK